MSTTRGRSHDRWQIGWLVPRILVLIGIIDLFFRWIPAEWRGYEVAERAGINRVQGEPFERNLKLRGVGYGDLIRMGNLTPEELRQQEFATDSFGFRNLPSQTAPKGIVFGDSFAYLGDSDMDTLAAKLGSRIGCRVYNAAGGLRQVQRPLPDEIHAVTSRVDFNSGFIIFEQVEWSMYLKPENGERDYDSIDRSLNWANANLPGFWRILALPNRIQKLFRRSQLEVVAEAKLRLLKNDVIVPNSYASNVVKAVLRNGDRILFYPGEIETYERIWPTSIQWIKLAQEALDKTRLEIIVVLVPNKYTVYHHLLSSEFDLAAEPGELLNRIEQELKSSNVRVINLTKALQADAELNIDKHEYNYYREDSHWNPRGKDIAVAEIENAFPELRAACR